jgi:uncharacterized OB-fold protein
MQNNNDNVIVVCKKCGETKLATQVVCPHCKEVTIRN